MNASPRWLITLLRAWWGDARCTAAIMNKRHVADLDEEYGLTSALRQKQAALVGRTWVRLSEATAKLTAMNKAHDEGRGRRPSAAQVNRAARAERLATRAHQVEEARLSRLCGGPMRKDPDMAQLIALGLWPSPPGPKSGAEEKEG